MILALRIVNLADEKEKKSDGIRDAGIFSNLGEMGKKSVSSK